MHLEIKSTKEEKLLSRKEYEVSLEYEGTTPSRDSVRKELAKKLGVKEELLIIKAIYTGFGRQRAEIVAFLYKDKPTLDKIEPEDMLKKHSPKKQEVKEEEKGEGSVEIKEEAE